MDMLTDRLDMTIIVLTEPQNIKTNKNKMVTLLLQCHARGSVIAIDDDKSCRVHIFRGFKMFIWGGISSVIWSEILFHGDTSAEP